MKERNSVLIVDGGGRGTALVKKYSESPHVDKIFSVPGNDWMKQVSEKPVETFPNIKTTDTVKIGMLCKERGINLVDVASDAAVEANLVGMLKVFKVFAVGPTREAGKLEWDKQTARAFGSYFKLPQPKFDVARTEQHAEKILDSKENARWFVKATGLADGKGAIPATSKKEALEAMRWLRENYPDSSKFVVFEEWLEGEEFSAFAISDSRNFKILGYAQDHKREFDGDKGENTGGMGAVSNPILTRDYGLQKKVEDIFQKTIVGAKSGGMGYRGVLYLGGMVVDKDGKEPYVIEFNARWGDPEAQVLVPGLNVDFFEMGMESAKGTLRRVDISDDGKVRVAVVGAAKGYPRSNEVAQVRGKEIFGLKEAGKTEGVTIFGAGVKVEGDKHYVNGGRLFSIVGEGKDVIQARDRAREAMDKVKIEGDNLHFRTDIGWRDVERLNKV